MYYAEQKKQNNKVTYNTSGTTKQNKTNNLLRTPPPPPPPRLSESKNRRQPKLSPHAKSQADQTKPNTLPGTEYKNRRQPILSKTLPARQKPSRPNQTLCLAQNTRTAVNQNSLRIRQVKSSQGRSKPTPPCLTQAFPHARSSLKGIFPSGQGRSVRGARRKP